MDFRTHICLTWAWIISHATHWSQALRAHRTLLQPLRCQTGGSQCHAEWNHDVTAGSPLPEFWVVDRVLPQATFICGIRGLTFKQFSNHQRLRTTLGHSESPPVTTLRLRSAFRPKLDFIRSATFTDQFQLQVRVNFQHSNDGFTWWVRMPPLPKPPTLAPGESG